MTVFECEYPVDSQKLDPWGTCRPSGVLGLLQEAATGAAGALQASHEKMLEKYHVFWMLARVWYTLARPLGWEERVTVQTWHRGAKGASSYRDFDLFVNGAQVGEAVSLWVLADAQTRKLARVSALEEFQGTDGGERCKSRTLSKLVLPPDMSPAGERTFWYSDLDMNGHVNNIKYADFVCDALRMEDLGPDRFVSSLQVGYQAECRAGETVDLFTGAAQGLQYVHGTGGGKTRFDAAVTISKRNKEGRNYLCH